MSDSHFVGKSFPSLNLGSDAIRAPISSTKRMAPVDSSRIDPQLLKSAEGMEAMFIDYMMKVMRETVPKNEMDLESPASNLFRGMLDSQYAEKAAHRGGIGLADQIVAYLEARGYNRMKGQGVTVKEKP